jgi:hypothetical protein
MSKFLILDGGIDIEILNLFLNLQPPVKPFLFSFV